jgi:hypothetical protein
MRNIEGVRAAMVPLPATEEEIMTEQLRITDSTLFTQIGYDPQRGCLRVEFCNGTAYMYMGVPDTVFCALVGAQSRGSYYNKHIRSRFRSVKLEAEG